MENSAEALKFAFAIFVFIIALSIAFITLSQAKSTADTVFYHTDKTNFQKLYNVGDNVVGVDNVISTLFRYYKESISVTIIDASASESEKIIAIFDTAIEKNCPWKSSNAKRRERIEEFITGDDVCNCADLSGSPDFYYKEKDGTDEKGKPINNNFEGGQLKYTTHSATKSLIELVGGEENLKKAKFRQKYIEVTTDGIYYTPDHYETPEGEALENDGTSIQITPGTKKVYITYEYIRND